MIWYCRGVAQTTQRRLLELYLAHGFLRFGVAELAARLKCSKSTLYVIAPSKEQIITATVRAYFKAATEVVERRVADHDDPATAVAVYLMAVAEELEPASAQFFADLHAFEPAGAIYRQNTALAAARVTELVTAAAPGEGTRAVFAGAVAGTVMEAINRGDFESRTGLNDAAAYRELADMMLATIGGRPS